MVGPWAVLGSVLAIIATKVGPHVVLPPQIGGMASLNLFVGLVGPSGAGKDSAIAAAGDFLWIDVPRHELGSGQGIDSAYTEQTKNGPVQFNDTALFTAPEIDTVKAHASMHGSNLLATLRNTYNAAALGARYANKEKRRPVKAHHYRFALIAGIQPERSGVLLDDESAGTPQRWLWMPCDDPDAPDAPPPEPLPFSWQLPRELLAQGELFLGEVPDRIELKVCKESLDAAHNARLSQLRSNNSTGLDAHSLLTQRKVAALLSMLDGRAEVRDDDWSLAGDVIQVSTITRNYCVESMQKSTQDSHLKQASEDVDKDEYRQERTVQKLCDRILEQAPISMRDILQLVNSRNRPLVSVAIGRLAKAQLIHKDGLMIKRTTT